MSREIIYSVRAPKNLSEMTSEEVAEELQRTDVVIIPIGATECHGPHLPLATDVVLGVEASKRIVLKLAEEGIRAVAGPPIPFGISLPLVGFPGTVSLTPPTMAAVIKEVCHCLIEQGFRKLVLMMSHDWNLGVVYSTVQELSQREGVRVLGLNPLPYMKPRSRELLKLTGVEGHGGEGETARMLASIPELVVWERARAYHPERPEPMEGDVAFHFGGGVFDPPREMREETPIGHIGNPLAATAETGERCYDVMVDWACRVIKRHFND